jgi:hypothetical protein
MAVDNTGTLYLLSYSNHGIWRYAGGGIWANIRPANDAVSMSLDSAGNLNIVRAADGSVWRYDIFKGWVLVG